MSQTMTEEKAKSFSKFTTDKDLTLDDFIVFQDIDIEHITMMNRYNTLLNKTYTTDAEKAEMTALLIQLEEYMPTSATWNKLCACIKTMQMFIRDGIVIFINEKQQEFKNILANYKYTGDWNSTTLYKIGNGVRRNGFGFMSISDNNINQEPNAEIPSDSYWVRFTIKGDKGDPSLNISLKGNYNSTTTYNIGDACLYNGIMYYARVNGVIGILPTDQTNWAYANNVVVSDTQPIDTHVIWWDTNSNKFKRYTSNLKWESQTISASDMTIIDIANYFTSTDIESALQEIGLSLKNITTKLSLLTEDTNQKPLWRGNKIGATNANEISISTISGLTATNVQDGMSQLFTLANSGKTSIASVVGNVTGSNTHSQIANEIQYDKNILASNLTTKGINASGNSNLRDLVNAVGNITLQSMGGRQFASGVTPYVRSVTSITLNFVPYLILAKTNYNSDRYCIYFPTLGLNHVFYSEGMSNSPTVYTITGKSFMVDNGVGGDTLYWYALE